MELDPRFLYSRSARDVCPRCDKTDLQPMPRTAAASEQDWFACSHCGHLWSIPRDSNISGRLEA